MWQGNGSTEVIDNNLNPKWTKHFKVWFIFVKDIDLHFQVWNYNGPDPEENQLIGEVKFHMSELMKAKNQSLQVTLTLPPSEKGKKIRSRENRGMLTVRADKIKKTEDIIKFQISANLKPKKFLCFGVD